MRVAVIGTGYVGLVTGVVLADLGNDVICVDIDPHKVAMLKQGKSPIYEPGIEEMLVRGLRSNHLSISDSVAEATKASDIVFIAVGTPQSPDGAPDMKYVIAAATEIGRAVDHYVIVVNKSTVPVGSGTLVAETIAGQGVSADLFDIVSNPEFLREGSAIRDTLQPDRIVIGASNPIAAQRVSDLYATIDAPKIITDVNSAELIKYGSNSFLAMKISFINAISRICEACEADVSKVAEGMGADKRIGRPFLNAGLGWGGSCFPKDVAGMINIAAKFGYDFKLLKEVVAINDDQTLHFVDRIRRRLGGLKGKRIALMGLAFKPDTDDIRDAKSLVMIREILNEGGSVVAYDPIAAENVRQVFPDIEYANNTQELASGADALVLVTEWNEFRQIDLARLSRLLKQPLLFDGRRIYAKKVAEEAGFEYCCVGG